ncbi:hypothetical protein [Terrilactibacillus laevilacticus]|uniref:Uncharacterized protein n=1 Tax=Terrilactibacillus laevilacticus TaxID=1380157 RepID=A0ABW5PUM1_9BACI|nr:hypothetical protein [Terrilactibacillus laevilacticus]
MNIRGWFGYNGSIPDSLTNNTLDKLLELYYTALTQYFSAPETTNINQMIQHLRDTNLNTDRKRFLEWMIETGASQLKDIAATELPYHDQIIAKLEYDYYILGEEMDFDYPEDVRSTLIGIACQLPEYFKGCIETCSTLSITYHDNSSESEWLSDVSLTDILESNDIYDREYLDYEKQEIIYTVSNSEGANQISSLFFVT